MSTPALKPAEPVFTRVSAIYVGRRLTTKDQLAYFWLFDGEDKPRGYKKNLYPAQVGESFAFSQDGNKGIRFGPGHRPESLGAPPHPDRKTWVMKDTVADQEFKELRAKRKLEKRESEFKGRITPLKALLDTCTSHDERAAFINAVVSELWRR